MKLAISLIFALAANTFALSPEAKPNFLFVIVDDQSPFDLKTYNPASTLDTLIIDSLAAGGMVLDGAHHMGSWSGAVCTPSRHMVMSGRTVWHLPQKRKKNQASPHAPADLAEHTMAAVFNRSEKGVWRTLLHGKRGLENIIAILSHPPTFSDAPTSPHPVPRSLLPRHGSRRPPRTHL